MGPKQLLAKESVSAYNYSSSLRVAGAGIQARNLEERTKAQAMEEQCLLDCLAGFLIPQDHLLKHYTACSGMDHHTSINQENTL